MNRSRTPSPPTTPPSSSPRTSWRRSGRSWKKNCPSCALDAERERRVQERRLVDVAGERKKLLDAHYADAIPLDLLKSEQDRLTREIDNAEGRLAEVEGDFKKAEGNLQRALTRVGDCETAYREAAGPLRRQFNLAFFKRLLIDDEYTVAGELAEPFDTLLGDELRRAVAVRANEELQDAIERDHPRAGRRRSGDRERAAPTGARTTHSWALHHHRTFFGVVVLVRNIWCG